MGVSEWRTFKVDEFVALVKDFEILYFCWTSLGYGTVRVLIQV